MSTTEHHIKEICRLAKQANSTDDTIDEAYGLDREMGVTIGDENYLRRHQEKNIIENALESYLTKLSSTQLETIHAVMYCGRDSESIPELKKYFKSLNYQKPDYMRTILEKRMNLVQYLTRGLELARSNSENLN